MVHGSAPLIGGAMNTENRLKPRVGPEDEIDYILALRAEQNRTEKDVKENLVGLALSGGGIRSATFGLGVLEGLKKNDLLNKIDYLSTVSGGGYIGGWLSANCRRAANRKDAGNNNILPATATPAEKEAYANASRNWLDKGTAWDDSIAHLRRYSNYLSPDVGLFSADTWSMVAIWLRNSLLVQLTVILAMAVLLLLPRLLFPLFDFWPNAGNLRWTSVALFILAATGIAANEWQLKKNDAMAFFQPKYRLWRRCGALFFLLLAWRLQVLFHFEPFSNDRVDLKIALIALLVALCLVLAGFFLLPDTAALIDKVKAGIRIERAGDGPRQFDYSQARVQWMVVIPMMATGFLVAAILWGQAYGSHKVAELTRLETFSGFFMTAWHYWPFPLSVALVSLWPLSIFSSRNIKKGWIAATFAPVLAVLVLYALLCAIMLLMHRWANPNTDKNGELLAFVLGPSLVLCAFSLAIVMLIGMMGRESTERVREWWSRLGAWFGIYGMAWMLIAVAAVYGPKFGPELPRIILDGNWKVASGVGVWLATTLAGLLAGNSAATGSTRKSAESEQTGSKKLLNLVAIVAPFVFIAGLLIGISTCLEWIVVRSSCHIPGPCFSYSDHITPVLGITGAALAGLLIMAWRVDINEFSLNAFYRSRLSRCYLGATRFLARERNPQKFTAFDDADDLKMSELAGTKDQPPAGPLHIVNCALNLGGSSDLALHTRHSASFTLTPYMAGSGYVALSSCGEKVTLGYQKIVGYGGPNGQPTLAQAMSVSGAAASPNMGFHTSPAVAFMLTMFNARLGWWFPKPNTSRTTPSPWFSLRYLFQELFGGADDKSNYLMVSDGGHFENMAAYELIRRRCRVIIISDAECDPDLKFEGLGSLIRMCEVDFGTRIAINVDAIRVAEKSKWSGLHCAVGTITYPCKDASGKEMAGVLIYLKASMTGREDAAVLQYKACHPQFPHESTANQFYGEDQFESYRRLGKEVVESAFKPMNGRANFLALAAGLSKNSSSLPRASRLRPLSPSTYRRARQIVVHTSYVQQLIESGRRIF